MSDPTSPDPPRQLGDPAGELAAVRLLKAEAARLSEQADLFLAEYPGAAEDVRWAVEELLRINSRLDGRLRELRSGCAGGATPEPE
jgi:hypothetical protein